MTAAIAAKLNLKLWQINFVSAYLNSLTKEDIYMKQPEGFVEPGFEDYVCKLVHTIYGTMQGTHDWYETLMDTYNQLGYTTSQADPCVRMETDILSQTHTWTMFLEHQDGQGNPEEERRDGKEVGDKRCGGE